jgi:hypothetical protein
MAFFGYRPATPLVYSNEYDASGRTVLISIKSAIVAVV